MATRFYFRATEAAAVSPAYDAAWTNTASAARRALARSRLTADTIAAVGFTSFTAGQDCIVRQFVSEPLAAGNVFTGETVTAYARGRESDLDDNITSRIGVRVVSEDGATERAVLLAVGHHGTGNEYPTTATLRAWADDAALSSYVTQAGDRLVVEMGHGDTAGTSPSAVTEFGSSAASDHTENETSQAANNPWIEFSNTLVFEDQVTDVDTLRTREHADCAYILFVEGLPYAWVTDHDDDELLGTDWISLHEAASSHEVVGQRQVLPGLVVPDPLPIGALNRKDGLLEKTTPSFKILDESGILAALFANEGKEEYTLAQRLAPTTTAASNPIIVAPVEGGVVGPSTSIDPANMNVGIERIGPNRERRFFYPLPTQHLGIHHQVNGDSQDSTMGPAPIPVTTEPTIFQGRMCALYRLYRDPGRSGFAAWAPWYEYRPIWVGTMRDQGQYLGNREWRIDCFGPESLLRKQLGTVDTAGWMSVSNVELALSDEERQIAIAFYRWDDDNGDIDIYPSRAFGTVTLPASGTPDDYVAAVSAAVQDLADGSVAGDFDDGFTDPFLDHDITGTAVFPQNGVTVTAQHIGIKRPSNAGLASNVAGMTGMIISLHETVWRLMGWEPAEQKTNDPDPSDPKQVGARKLEPGELFLLTPEPINDGIVSPGGGTSPAPGYWNLYFNTKGTDGSLSNSGAFRYYEPYHSGGASSEISIFTSAGEQDFSVSAQFPYIEGDPTVDREGFDAARYFLFRGKRTLPGGEPEDTFQVARVQWDINGSAYGTVDDSSGATTLHLRAWNHPRRFGVDDRRFTGEWAFEPGGEFGIECKPLVTWPYYEAVAGKDMETAWGMFLALLLSTGSATPLTNGAFTAGTNDAGFDIFGSEMALGLPSELVADTQDVIDAFGTNDFGRVRYAYADPISSWELFADLVQCRGLALSLDDMRFGVVAMATPDPADVSITITELDIYSPPGRPQDTAPVQQVRATGALDEMTLATRWDPAAGAVVDELAYRARDPGARWRIGDLKETLPAHGLIPDAWMTETPAAFDVHAWGSEAQQIWAIDRPRFLAKRHFLVRTKLSRIQGQDLYPGTRVFYTNRKVVNPAGPAGVGADADGYGVENALGLVLSVSLHPGEHSYDVEILIFADQFFDGIRLFAPIGEITNPWSGGTSDVPITEDALGAGESSAIFIKPAWASGSGNLRVGILWWDRTGWTLDDLGGSVYAASQASGVVTLSASVSAFHTWTKKYLVALDWDAQADGEWPRSLLVPLVDSDHTFGSGPTTGWPLVEG